MADSGIGRCGVFFVEVKEKATKVQLGDELVNEVVRLGAHRSRKEAVSKALEQYVGHLRRLQIVDMFGTADYDPDYDYKKQRKRK